MGRAELLYGRGRAELELILEDDQAEETEVGLCLFPGRGAITKCDELSFPKLYSPFHTLRLQPRQAFNTLASNGNDTVAAPCVVGQKVVIVVRNC